MTNSKQNLKARILEDIAITGPMPLSRYMSICLGDPWAGYYMKQDPFGSEGDFTTAPEISQMFGELIGAWLVAMWETLGSPDKVRIVELGPGRGTLMADCLRSLALRPELTAGLQIDMVETSPVLIEAQKRRLENAPCTVRWCETLESNDLSTLVVANEFFDALPVHVLIKTIEGLSERHVVAGDDNTLVFADLPASLPNGFEKPKDMPIGTVFELSPERHQMMQSISHAIKTNGGAALLIDYGFTQPKTGTTFQALTNHAPVDPLTAPGEADLTSLVDFTGLQRGLHADGLYAHGPISQMDFLLNLGLLERAGTLGSGADAKVQNELQQAVERLVSPDEMGTLFKVLAVSTAETPPAGFEKLT